MNKKAKWVIITVSFVVPSGLSLLLLAGRLSQDPHGTGSIRYARIGVEKLAACDSLADVRKKFNCGRWRACDQGSGIYV